MSANMKTELLALWMLPSHDNKGQNPGPPHPISPSHKNNAAAWGKDGHHFPLSSCHQWEWGLLSFSLVWTCGLHYLQGVQFRNWLSAVFKCLKLHYHGGMSCIQPFANSFSRMGDIRITWPLKVCVEYPPTSMALGWLEDCREFRRIWPFFVLWGEATAKGYTA